MFDSVRILKIIGSIAAIVVLTWAIILSPDQASAQGAQEARPYITVEIRSGDDSVSWNHPDGCSSTYNLYLAVTSGAGVGQTTRTHLGSAASGSTQATLPISYSSGSFFHQPFVELELYCGEYADGSSANDLVTSSYLSMRGPYLRSGTFSSSPLTALSVGSSTLAPSFNRGINRYTTDVPSDERRVTVSATALSGYQLVYVENPGWGVVSACGHGCSYSYGDGTTTGVVLADTDGNTPGFQIDLDEGENRLGIGLHKGDEGAGPGRLYYLTVTVRNVAATGRPAISGTYQVGQRLMASMTDISDEDGLDDVLFSYQWIRVNSDSTETDIAGATGSTYTLASADAGKTIKVQVTFTDDAGNQESLTSASTPAVAQVGAQSADSTLSSLTLSGVNFGTFQSATTSYTARVNNSVTETTVAPTANQSGASYAIKLGGVTDEDGVIPLTEGSNVVTVEVTAEDGQTKSTYTVTITRLSAGLDPISSDATLSGLVLSGINFGTFSSGTTSYGANVVWDVSETTVTPTVSHSDSRYVIKQNGVTDSDGTLSLHVGINAITVEVIAEDGSTTETYSVNVNRAAPPSNDARLKSLSINHVEYSRRDLEHYTSIGVTFRTNVTQATVRAAANHPGANYVLKVDGVEDDDGVVPVVAVSAPIKPSITIEVTAEDEQTTRTYHLSPRRINSRDATLGALTLSGIDFGTFSSGTTSYTANVAYSVTETTVTPTKGHSGASYVIKLGGVTDTDGTVSLTTGSNVITVEVTAENGRTTETYTVTVTRAASSNTVPGAPHSVAAEPAGTGELSVSWQEPASNGGSEITGYKVQWKLASGNWDTQADVSEVTATDTSHTIGGLQLDVEYAVRVIATNGEGDGPASDEASATPVAQVSQLQVRVQNTPATGAPTISGTVQVGETLTADTSGIIDADGLTKATFSYQWVRDDGASDADIEGAADSTYALVSDDEGKTLKVRVSFTDDADNEESLTSIATATVAAALTAELLSVPDSHDGQNDFTFRILFSEDVTVGFQALKEDSFEISNGTIRRARRVDGRNDLRQFTVRPSSDAAAVLVLEADRPCDLDGAICTSDGKRLSNRLELTVPGPAGVNTPATGAPTISGTAQVGQSLTSSTSGIVDSDGLVNATFIYQWLADDTVISGATGSTYTLVDADEGKTVKVRVRFTDDAGHEETLTSPATATVEAKPNTPATGVPTISGTAQVGETLTTDKSGISDADGLTDTTFSYQWLADDADISGATGSTYTLAPADEGKTIKVRVSFTDDGGNDETLTSAATAAVEAAPDNHDRPHGLQATAGADAITLTWQDPDTHRSYGYYQILRHRPELGEADPLVYVDYISTSTRTFVDSGVAPGVLYVYAVKAVKDPFGYLGPASTPVEVRLPPAASPNSPATGAPTITGTVQVGEILTADTSGIVDADGLTDTTFSYQWLADDTDISGATGSTYTLVDADEGKAIKVRVSFTDDGGNDESLTSEATATVSVPVVTSTPPPAPTNLSVTLNEDGSLTLNWTAPSDDSVTGYQILRRRPQMGEDTLLVYVSDTGSTATTYTDTSTSDDTRYIYRVKARNGDLLSEWSNFARVDK